MILNKVGKQYSNDGMQQELLIWALYKLRGLPTILKGAQLNIP